MTKTARRRHAWRHSGGTSAPSVSGVPGNRTRSLALYAVILAFVALVGARWLHRDSNAPRPDASDGRAAIEVRADAGERATVHVAGEVRRPGVYRLRSGARVHEAVMRAGGPTARADTTQVNLAAKVEDGRQILVPARVDAHGNGSPAIATGVSPSSAVPVNLNTATLEQLDGLDGIGPATAQQILDYRDANNGFGSVEELAEVPGIGDKRLASLREQVRV